MSPLPPFVGVVTFNPMATMRFELLERTVRSIEKAFPTGELFLFDNLSDDGSRDAVCEMLGTEGSKCEECGGETMRGRWHVPSDLPWPGTPSMSQGPPKTNRTPGAGRARLLNAMLSHIPPKAFENVFDRLNVHDHDHWPRFFACSDDDMEWRDGAQATLTRFWDAKPDKAEKIEIVSGLLEPVWHWNTPRRTAEHGGVKVLVRDSAPGAAWTFRTIPIHLLSPGTSKERGDELWRFGYDYELCKLVRMSCEVAQIDLAEHIGWGFSTHGNEANEAPDTKPLDREKWGV